MAEFGYHTNCTLGSNINQQSSKKHENKIHKNQSISQI